ncbi:MAG: hypothetical protein LC781_07260 [Actinobacteria bacterium]|nr:hypothetical protein [Actinomycetota bacterium]
MTERRGIEVRWGLREDEDGVAELLELNGMPRPLAFEERFVVAVAGPEGELLATLSYRTASKRLLLGFLVADPWVEERSLARALYAGAIALAREAGIGEIQACPSLYGDYPGEVGYRWCRGGWRADAALALGGREELPAGGWRRVFVLLGFAPVPFFRAFRG